MSTEQIRAAKAKLKIQFRVVAVMFQSNVFGNKEMIPIPDASFDTEQQAEAFILNNYDAIFEKYGPVTVIKTWEPATEKSSTFIGDLQTCN